MRKAQLPLTILVLLLSIGCAPTIRRTGYTPEAENAGAATYADCNVRITRNSNVPAEGTVIGTMKIGDSGFSTNCGEDKVLDILRTEACRIGADIIMLHHIRQPDFLSSCYRVSADFVKVNENSVEAQERTTEKQSLPDEGYYSDMAVAKRTKTNKELQACFGIASAILGCFIGYMLTSPK